MSANLYFTDEVRNLPGFKSTPYADGSGDRMQIGGITLFNDRGRLCTFVGDEGAKLPEELQKYVAEFSLYITMAEVARRETGIYCQGSAEAELEVAEYSKGRLGYRVRARGKKAEDVRELLRMIRAGEIRPERSYEGQQIGMSRSELEAKVASLAEKNGELHSAMRKLAELRKLADDLRAERWPWCSKISVADKIRQWIG